jgi:hypothetical protein
MIGDFWVLNGLVEIVLAFFLTLKAINVDVCN